MQCNLVSLHGMWLVEQFSTEITLERLLSNVDSHVHLHIGFLTKTSAAFDATIWFLSVVDNTLMQLLITITAETPATDGARERLLPSVHSHVHLFPAEEQEHLVAEIALESQSYQRDIELWGLVLGLLQRRTVFVTNAVIITQLSNHALIHHDGLKLKSELKHYIEHIMRHAHKPHTHQIGS